MSRTDARTATECVFACLRNLWRGGSSTYSGAADPSGVAVGAVRLVAAMDEDGFDMDAAINMEEECMADLMGHAGGGVAASSSGVAADVRMGADAAASGGASVVTDGGEGVDISPTLPFFPHWDGNGVANIENDTGGDGARGSAESLEGVDADEIDSTPLAVLVAGGEPQRKRRRVQAPEEHSVDVDAFKEQLKQPSGLKCYVAYCKSPVQVQQKARKFI